MKRFCPGRKRLDFQSARRGFTIIELLVVIAILLLLTTFTILSVDFAFESEKVRSGARQIQSVLEGARDRAIKSRQPRGVRFLVDQDPDSGRMVSSMVYVGAAEPWSNGQITLMRPDLDWNGVVDPGLDNEKVWMIHGDPGTLWTTLKQRGYLGTNNERPRIKIPGDRNGTWYNVDTKLLDPSDANYRAAAPNRLVLTRAYRDPGTTPPNERIAFEGTGPSTYVLELPPRVMSDAEPVLLPEGIVIDMDASRVPDHWRPGSGKGYADAYSNRMDLMFTPRGTVLGSAAGVGILHFYITRRVDVDVATRMAGRPAVNRGMTPLVPAEGLFAAAPAIGGDPPKIGDRSLVSVFTATGKVASHPIDTIDQDVPGAPGYGYVDDPFVFAERGEVSSK